MPSHPVCISFCSLPTHSVRIYYIYIYICEYRMQRIANWNNNRRTFSIAKNTTHIDAPFVKNNQLKSNVKKIGRIREGEEGRRKSWTILSIIGTLR